MATTKELKEAIEKNTDEIKDIKDNHLTSIYKTLWQIKGTLIVLVPLLLAILGIVIAILKNGI